MKFKVLQKFSILILIFSVQSIAQNDSLELNEVVVESHLQKQSQPLVTAPGSHIKKRREDIKEKVSPDLSQILSFEPNVEFVGGPRPQAELPRVRGLGADRILILDEGVRQNFQSGHNGRIFSDFSIMESIEIVKGPWSSLYGSGAMGGVLSFQRATASDYIKKYGLDRPFELSTDFQSQSNLFGARVTAFTKHNKLEPLISYRQSKNGNIRLSSGRTLDYSASEESDFYLSLGYQVNNNQKWNFKVNQFNDQGQSPTNPQLEVSQSSQLSETQQAKNDIVIDFSHVEKGWEFRLKPYLRETQIEQRRLSDSRVEKRKVTTVGFDSWLNHSYEINSQLNSLTTYGVELFQDTNRGERNQSSLPSFPNATSQELGVYFQPTFVWNKKWSLIPGVRWDFIERKPENSTLSVTSEQKQTSKLYTQYEYLPEKSLYAGWGQSFRSPRLQDIYVDGLHFPGQPPFMPNNYFLPNPNLRPEVADTFEVGSRQRYHLSHGALVDWNLNVFQTEAKDFIFQDVKTSAGTTEFINFDQVRLQGFEASFIYSFNAWIWGISYGEVRSLNKITGQVLADTQADQWNLNVSRYLSDAFKIGFDSRYIEKQNLVPQGVSETGDYFLADVFFSFEGSSWGQWHLRVTNLLDRSFKSHGTFIEGPSRSFNFNWTKAF